MTAALNHSALERWRRSPIEFIETVLHDPETKRPFVLLLAERSFLQHAFKLDNSGRLLYPEHLREALRHTDQVTQGSILAFAIPADGGSGRLHNVPHPLGGLVQRTGLTPTPLRHSLLESAPVLLQRVKNIERGATDPRSSTLGALQQAFEKAGVIFLEPGDIRDGGAGVRLKKVRRG
jgi:hypothetical protein